MERSAILCPHCGAIESVTSVVCHRCGKILRKVAEVKEVAAFLGREDLLVKTLQWTYSIVFLITLFLAVEAGGSPIEALLPGEAFHKAVFKMGALSGIPVFRHGEWFRLFTAMFVHFGLIHLFFNSMALGAVGLEAEKNLGPLRFLFIYLVGGVAANVVSLWWHREILVWSQVGASGAICALMGSLYMIARMRGGVYDQIVRRIVTRWIVLTVLIGFLIPQIDNVAHIAGMIAGVLLTKLTGIKRPREFYA